MVIRKLCKWRCYIVTLLLLVTFSVLSAPSARFQKLSVEDGLPNQTIWSVTQDQQGFIWLGTIHGLVRFDGQNLLAFQADEKKRNVLTNNVVKKVISSKNGGLWIGTYKGGLNYYDPLSEKFSSFQIFTNDRNNLNTDSIQALVENNDGSVWVASEKGLALIRGLEGSIEHFSHMSDGTKSLRDKSILTLMNDNLGSLWVGTSEGIAVINKERTSLFWLELPLDIQPSIRSFHQSRSGNIWIGTEKGLYYHTKISGKTSFIEGIEASGILSLTSDNDDTLWVGTRTKGIYLVRQNEVNSKAPKTNFQYDKGTNYSIGGNAVVSLYKDYSGVIWAGTFSAGVYWIDPQLLKFGHYDDSSNGISCLPSSIIYSFLIDTDKSLWVGTRDGLAHIDTQENCNIYKHSADNKNSLSDNEIHKIYRTSDEKLWFGTALGINRLDPKKREFERFIGQFPALRVLDIAESPQGKILIGSAKGLYEYNPKDSSFNKIPVIEQSMAITNINRLASDLNDNYLLATNMGLLKYDGKKRIIDYFKVNGVPVSTDPLKVIHADPFGNIWIGINNEGILRITSNNSIERINEYDGLPKISKFSNILTDSDSNLWIGTGLGLIKYNYNTKKSTTYRKNDGLQSDIFIARAELKDPSGKMFFGGFGGYNAFNPDDIQINTHPPKLALTNFIYFGEAISPTANSLSSKLERAKLDIHNLELTYRDHDFGFEFSALHFSNYTKNRYAYQLEGYDKNWHYRDSLDTKVNYTNLNAGNYVFKVKAANKDGVWSKEPLSINILISPAPWASPIAYLVYILLLIGSIVGFIKYRTRALENRSRMLEKSIQLRTRELAIEKSKVENLLSKKNEEFANLSHEFRTPLTLIIGPIKQLLSWNPEDKYKKKLNIVQRNSLRLLRMIDQLLNLATFRVKAITQKSPQAISKITQLISEAFSDLAAEKDIIFVVKKIDPICFDFTPDAIEKILLNLLSNAIKYTKSGGDITVSAIRDSNNQYKIKVTDTGIGIAKDKLSSVFERFNRVMDENSEQVTGSGIGLALVKSLVETHEGSVELKSELGKGTTITVTLPIINEVDESHINIHQNDEIIAMELMNISSSSPTKDSLAEQTKKLQSSEMPTVLIIEDNDDMRQYIVESIAQQFNTLVAADGRMGLELAIQEVPDVIISDIMMPKLDGYQTTRALREEQITNHIPVVLLTARGDRDSRLKGWEEKADEYITKPFDVEELKIRLLNLLEIREILKRRFSEDAFDNKPLVLKTRSDSLEENIRFKQQQFLDKLNSVLEPMYFNSSITVADLASASAMSERQFFRKLKNILGMTPSEYIRRFRLEKAKILLERGKSVTLVSMDVGFSSQSYFSKCFKAQYQVSAKEYQNKIFENSTAE
ncbi:MAG: two-component regulator propeller domain-containing protein [Kangiellaceae bacterium]